MTVGKGVGETRRHIIESAEILLAERGSSELHLADVAELARVGLQTIYYHFDSRTQLIAEAQASAYFRLIGPLHECLTTAEMALLERDELTFWSALSENVILAWSYVKPDDQWQITKLLIDIWADQKTRDEFRAGLEVQVERWIDAIESAKPLGWIKPELDTYALVTSCWAASIGQALFINSSKIQYTPQSICDFFVRIARVVPNEEGKLPTDDSIGQSMHGGDS
ncbi:MAG: TetR/AcrR family transcriptional regulator [Acidimicrobiales bacterium]